MHLGAPFSPSWKSQGGAFRLRARPVVISELRSGIHILGRHFHVQSPWVGNSECGIFSGLESARLWLRNSGAVFASWGAVFTWFGAQRAAFFTLRGRLFVFDEFKGGTCISGGGGVLPGRELKRRHFAGLEGSQLCLRNSGAAFASCGAVFRCRVLD